MQHKQMSELQARYGSRRVVLVDQDDREIGEAGLLEAHRDPGMTHRAFSLFLYRKNNGATEILLQQRSSEKPVFPLLWTNTCCYNMVRGEEYLTRAASRVFEEMGVHVDPQTLQNLYTFSYYAPDSDGWCENEVDTVILGEWSGEVNINLAEVADYRWARWDALVQDLMVNPSGYAPWFKLIMQDSRLKTALGE